MYLRVQRIGAPGDWGGVYGHVYIAVRKRLAVGNLLVVTPGAPPDGTGTRSTLCSPGPSENGLTPAAARAMKENQNPRHLEAPWGIGWALRDSRVWNFFGDLVSPQTFGHVGATGTVAWADLQTDLVCVILTNGMVEDGSLLNRVSNTVAAAIVE